MGNGRIQYEGSLAAKYPNIAAEWHPTRNKGITASMYVPGSPKKIWWICSNNHVWQDSIINRVNGYGCPECAITPGEQQDKDLSLAAMAPELIKEWDYDKNTDIDPYKVKYTSAKHAFWICSQGHKWETEIRVRAQRKNGCPYCTGRYAVKGVNDLESRRPDIAKEFDIERNGTTPDKVIAGSKKKYWWKCDKGHSWQTDPDHRTSRNQGCPYCYGRYAITGENDLATLYPDLLEEWDYKANKDIDPTKIKPKSEIKAQWICKKCGRTWKTLISDRTEGKGCPHCAGIILVEGKNDLLTKHPEVAAEWHPTKNGELKPNEIAAHSKKKVWWLGKCGHEWKADPDHRSSGRGCPICLGRKAIVVDRSIQEYAYEIVKEWHPDKNGDMTPYNTFVSTNKKIWWRCDKGHEWQASPNTRFNFRTGKYNGCPICSGHRLSVGDNDLATVNSELAKQWHPTKNGELKPTDVQAGSSKKVWWQCENGHEWQAVIYSRKTRGCPYCSKKTLIKGVNDFETLYPDLVSEWNYEKNGDLKPSDVTGNTHEKVWWKCKEGHEWKISPHNRAYGSGCPYCSGRMAITGVNDIQTLYPRLMEEWNFEKNKRLDPSKIKSGSTTKKAWWKCKNCGHEWRTAIYTRVMGTGCPECFRLKKRGYI